MDTTRPLPRPVLRDLRERLLPFARTATGLAVFSLGVLVAHVLDDAFLQPSPGTGALDHVAAGLIPAAVLTVAALGYGQVRAGWQATIGLVLGVFGLVLAVEAVYDAVTGDLSGDDFSGLAAVPAGATLIGIAAVTLWRSRRMDAHLRRYVRRTGLVVVGLVSIYAGLFAIAMPYGITHIGRDAVADVEPTPDAQPVVFRSTDGLQLAGLYVPSRNGAAVISFPGPGALDHARMLARHGYGVLMFDQRGEGDSEGDPNALGWQAERDVRGAIAFLQRQPDVDPARIGALGLSVGGETLIQTAAHTDDLAAVVSDGAGVRSSREQRHLGGVLETARFAAVTAGAALFSSSLPPADLTSLAAQAGDTPLLLIYAEHGQGGEELSADYAAAAGPSASAWMVPGAAHTQGLETSPVEYEQRVIGFLDDALLGGGAVQ